ncbi:MAG: ypmQ [Burkholderiaceae bacterium]|nr:ypmQ [Burkholderiaceae bacterium]
MKHPIRVVLSAFALSFALVACQPTTQYLNSNITASNLHTDIPLTSHTGEPLQINSPQKGKVSAVFFGYTQCPDICPTTLGKMKIVMEQLGADASKVRVVFVTLDPERDTQQVLKEYMEAFNPTFIGAYTDPAQTKIMANQFQVVYEKVGTDPNYIVNHTANLYLLDENGRTVVSVPYEAKPETIAHDIKQLLAQYR